MNCCSPGLPKTIFSRRFEPLNCATVFGALLNQWLILAGLRKITDARRAMIFIFLDAANPPLRIHDSAAIVLDHLIEIVFQRHDEPHQQLARELAEVQQGGADRRQNFIVPGRAAETPYPARIRPREYRTGRAGNRRRRQRLMEKLHSHDHALDIARIGKQVERNNRLVAGHPTGRTQGAFPAHRRRVEAMVRGTALDDFQRLGARRGHPLRVHSLSGADALPR